MANEPYRSPPSFSEPVRQLVAGASDEQLAWIVGPDRDFYSDEAVEAATLELDRRRAEAVEGPPPIFNIAAFAFGPFWYFYHGMFGRGSLIVAVLLGALYGLLPIADALGIPTVLWVMAVVLSVGGYCGRYASRDLAESQTQARLYPRYGKPPKPRRETPEPFVHAALVGCRMVGEQAKAMLEAEGISTIVKCENTGVFGPGSGCGTRSVHPAQVLVPTSDLEHAREVLTVLLAEVAEDPMAGCDDEEPSSEKK